MSNINPQLASYIEQQKQLAAQRAANESKKAKENAEENKRRQLIDAGLFNMVFDPEEKDVVSEAYPFLHYDTVTKKGIAYKKVPIELTDEEYKEFLKYYKPGKKGLSTKKGNQSSVSSPLFAWGLLLILVGAIGGYFLFYLLDAFAIVVMVGAIALGIILMVMSSVVDELKQIKNLLRRNHNQNNKSDDK